MYDEKDKKAQENDDKLLAWLAQWERENIKTNAEWE